jgi:dTDP-4-amino-4,6-dideoxygalactose transaminase
MSERDCAEMCVKLDHFPFWQERRQEIARDYTIELGKYVDIITDHKGQVSKFVIGTDQRDQLAKHLLDNKIETKLVYKDPLYNLPGAIKNCNQHLALPCDPYMTDEELLVVILAIKEFFQELPFKRSL